MWDTAAGASPGRVRPPLRVQLGQEASDIGGDAELFALRQQIEVILTPKVRSDDLRIDVCGSAFGNQHRSNHIGLGHAAMGQ